MDLTTILELLGLAAAKAPAIAGYLSDLADGDKTAVEKLRAVLPKESASARAAREMRDAKD
jgi:hypothetical protein